jgi:hypothetical protein
VPNIAHIGHVHARAKFAELVQYGARELADHEVLSSGELERIGRLMADIVQPPTEREARVLSFVDGRGSSATAVPLNRVTVELVLQAAMAVPPGQRDRAGELFVARTLKRHGWVRRREATGRRRWYYSRSCDFAKDGAGRQEIRA